MDNLERLISLLRYSEQAIAYWFDSDVPEELRTENDHYKSECSKFISMFECIQRMQEVELRQSIEEVSAVINLMN